MSVQASGDPATDRPDRTETYVYHNRGLWAEEDGGNAPNQIFIDNALEISPEPGIVWEIYAIDYNVWVDHSDASNANPSDGVFFHWTLGTNDGNPNSFDFSPGSGAIPTSPDAVVRRIEEQAEESGAVDGILLSKRGRVHAAHDDGTEAKATSGQGPIVWDDRWNPPEPGGRPNPYTLDFRTDLNFNFNFASSMEAVSDDTLHMGASFTFWIATREAQV